MSNARLFTISLLVTVVTMLGVLFVKHLRASSPKLVHLSGKVFVSSQLKQKDFPLLRKRGFETIVDFRPDGEDREQPPSTLIEAASKANGMKFHYIPVPHEGIPDEAVKTLGDVLSEGSPRCVLYCRTGRRAVKTFALVEASRADGPAMTAILEMVRASGFSADDISDRIARRIAERSGAKPTTN